MNIINDYVEKFENADGEKFPEIRQFLNDNLPIFTCNDKTLEEIYYFRAYAFTKHVKKNASGKYIITEWSSYYNDPISCAVGHHLSELKWFRNADNIAEDYIDYWCNNIKQLLYYNNWFIYAVYEYCVTKDRMDIALKRADKLEEYFAEFESMHKSLVGIYKCVDNYDGMEFQISAYGRRPTINSYIYGDAYALYKIFEYGNNKEKAEKYKTFCEDLKEQINAELFKDDFYYNQPIGLWEEMPRLMPRTLNHQDQSVKELIGYVPFYFGIGGKDQLAAWKYFADKKVFSAPYGLTTADMSHPQFNFEFNHPCLWNGPVWPYATSQTLTALTKTLRDFEGNDLPASRTDFCNAVKTYAKSQHIVTESGEVRPWIDENLDGQTGEWIARKWLFEKNRSDKARGKDYNHSTYLDIILGGLCGVIKRGNEILSKPLNDESISFSVGELV